MSDSEDLSPKILLQDGDISKGQDELIFDPFNHKNHVRNMVYRIRCIILIYTDEHSYISRM